MKILITVTFIIFTVLAAVESSFAKEWRGLTPLRSTRADVVRLLNQCSDQKEACAFTLGNESVYILFSGGLTEKDAECAKRLPPETVMFIDVLLKETPKIDSFRLDKKKFRTFNSSEKDLKGYWNENDGLLINTVRGRVIQVDYLPAALERFSCPRFYEDPESFIRTGWIHYGSMTIDCTATLVTAEDQFTCRAEASVNESRGYIWSVSPGNIISGQLTKQIKIDSTGLAGQTIVVTAEHRDGFGHSMFASFKVEVKPK